MSNTPAGLGVRSTVSFAAGMMLAALLVLTAGSTAKAADAGSSSANSSSQDDQLDEVVVTGYAGSLMRAIENKKNADVISDGLSAEDIGEFSEQNVAEALQRVTGVQITRALGDGQYISVRGLDPKFTDTLYNGRQLPSGSGSRAFDFQVLSADFASQIDVYKSPTADMLESGLAATVNVSTISPLAYGKEKLALTADGVYDEQAKEGMRPHLSGIFTDTLMDHRLGILVGVDFNERKIDDQTMSSDGVIADGTYTGPGTQYRLFSMHQNDNVGTDKRLSGVAQIEFQVTDTLKLKVDALASRFDQDYYNYQGNNWYTGAGALGPSPTTSETVNGNGVETNWSGTNVFQWVQANLYAYEQTMNSTALSATWTPGAWTVYGEGSFGQARETTTQQYISWATSAPGASLYYNTANNPGGPISFGFTNGFNPNNIGNYYFFGEQGAYQEPTTDKIVNFKVDASHPLEFGLLKSFKFGANYEDRTLANTPNDISDTTNGFAANMSPYLEVYDNPAFFSSYNGNSRFPTSFLTVNLPAFFKKYPVAKFAAENPPNVSLTTTTVVEEKSDALYGRLDFGSDDGRWKGNLGLRAVRTEELSSGYVPGDGSYLIYGLFGGANSLNYSSAGIFAQSNTYNNLLPDLNLSYRITNDLIGRIALAQVMQRPDMNLLAESSAPNAATQPPPSGTWNGTLAEGNPNLKPYLSNQFDVSLEWYFGQRGILSGDFFLKDVKNLVLTNYYNKTENVTLYGSGQVVPIDFAVSQPQNVQSTTLKGIEIGYEQPFDFLPGTLRGLGFQGNYTHIFADKVLLNEGQPPLPLTGVSSNTYNLGVYYNIGKADLHAVYNYRGEWVSDPLRYFGDGLWVKGYGQVDLTANYHLNKSFMFNASVVNLTQSALQEVDKYGVNQLYELSGRREYVGVRFTY